MRLARAAVAGRCDVLTTSDILRAGEFQHQGLVEGRQRLEVEAIEAFDGWELRFLNPPLDRPPFPFNQLQFDKPQQVADMVDALGGALTSELVIFAQERGKLEGFQIVSQQDLRGVGHAASPARSAIYARAEVGATVARGRYG